MERLIHIVFDVIVGFVVKVVGVVMMVSVLLQIASRYLPFTLGWTDEVARLMFVWFCMLSTAIAYEKGHHLCIDYFTLKMKRKLQVFLGYLSMLLVLAFSVVLTVKGIEILEIVSIQKSPVMQLSMSYFYASIPVGFGLVVIFSVLALIHRVQNHGKQEC